MMECFCFIRIEIQMQSIPEMQTFLGTRVLNQNRGLFVCLSTRVVGSKRISISPLLLLAKPVQKRECKLWKDENCVGASRRRAGGGLEPGCWCRLLDIVIN